MISTTKKIVYGALIAGSFALAVPTLLEARKSQDSTKAEPIERSAEGALPPGGSQDAFASLASPMAPVPTLPVPAGDPSGVPAPNEGLSASDPLGSLAKLESALGRLEGADGADPAAALDRLTRSKVRARAKKNAPQEEFETPQVAEPAQFVSQPASAPQETERVVAPRVDPLETFLERAPLCGMIRGASGDAAMFGGRIVRAGDELIPGDARIKSIEKHSVLVEYESREVRIELPPVVPRVKPRTSTQEGEQESGGADAGTEAPQAASAGASQGEVKQ